MTEVHLEIIKHTHCRCAAGTENTSARMLEWADEIQPVNSWNSVTTKVRSRSVSAELMLVPSDAM
ncbi:hypothetical protein D3C84_1163010 [compost metagenome]